MNPWQMAQQVKYLAQAATWAESPSEPVFPPAAVVCTEIEALQALPNLRFPLCLIGFGDITRDEETSAVYEQTFRLVVCQTVEGDPFGERASIGGPRTSSGQGSSFGRGIAEIEERLLNSVGFLTGADGARCSVLFDGAPGIERIDESRTLAFRRYQIRAWCSRTAMYEPPTNLVCTATGSGNVSVSWTNPAARWDFHLVNLPTSGEAARGKMILRRASGSTAPSSATAGSGVTLSSNMATSVTDSPGAGTFSYALFAAYNETGASDIERYSPQAVGSYRNGVVVT